MHNLLELCSEKKRDRQTLPLIYMPQASKKKSKVVGPQAQGRQNTFSGAKLEFLESYKNQFVETRDRGPFYTKVSKEFIERFGYNLAMEVNPEPDDDKDLTPDEIDTSLPVEEQNKESDRRSQFYRELREVSNILHEKDERLTPTGTRNSGAGIVTATRLVVEMPRPSALS
jgi:hypothetical protein